MRNQNRLIVGLPFARLEVIKGDSFIRKSTLAVLLTALGAIGCGKLDNLNLRQEESEKDLTSDQLNVAGNGLNSETNALTEEPYELNPSLRFNVATWQGTTKGVKFVFLDRTGTFDISQPSIDMDLGLDYTFSYSRVDNRDSSSAFLADWNGKGEQTIGFYDVKLRKLSVRFSNDSGKPDRVYDLPKEFSNDLTIAKPVVGDWDGDGIETIGVLTADKTESDGRVPINYKFTYLNEYNQPMKPKTIKYMYTSPRYLSFPIPPTVFAFSGSVGSKQDAFIFAEDPKRGDEPGRYLQSGRLLTGTLGGPSGFAGSGSRELVESRSLGRFYSKLRAYSLKDGNLQNLSLRTQTDICGPVNPVSVDFKGEGRKGGVAALCNDGKVYGKYSITSPEFDFQFQYKNKGVSTDWRRIVIGKATGTNLLNGGYSPLVERNLGLKDVCYDASGRFRPSLSGCQDTKSGLNWTSAGPFVKVETYQIGKPSRIEAQVAYGTEPTAFGLEIPHFTDPIIQALANKFRLTPPKLIANPAKGGNPLEFNSTAAAWLSLHEYPKVACADLNTVAGPGRYSRTDWRLPTSAEVLAAYDRFPTDPLKTFKDPIGVTVIYRTDKRDIWVKDPAEPIPSIVNLNTRKVIRLQEVTANDCKQYIGGGNSLTDCFNEANVRNVGLAPIQGYTAPLLFGVFRTGAQPPQVLIDAILKQAGRAAIQCVSPAPSQLFPLPEGQI